MYTVYGVVKSRALRVLWMLEELGQPYEHQALPPRHPDVVKLNGTGKIPVLLDGDQVIGDSVAIMTYLADKHGALTFPAGTIQRARQDALTNAVLEDCDATLWMAAKHSFVLPEEHRLPDIKQSLRWEFGRTLDRLEKHLGDGPFLMGDQITVPDLLLTHCLSWAIGARFPVENDTLRSYADRLRGRTAFLEALSRAS